MIVILGPSGAEQVLLWRRSTDVKPPELSIDDERYPGNDEKYKELTKEVLPTGNPICYELDDNLKPIRHYYLK